MKVRLICVLVFVAATGALVACGDSEVSGPQPPRPELTLADSVRELAAGRNVVPLQGPPPVRPERAALGQALAFDKILSGNRDISCMSCHLPSFGTGDGRHLAIGQGASGLGTARVHPLGAFIPRNAPPLFNLHAMRQVFWDGRVEVDDAGFVHTPAGEQVSPDMAAVFEFGAISALPLFPVTSREEMRAAFGDNELGDVDDADVRGIWAGLMARLGQIPEYVAMFEAAYPGTPFEEMTFAHASNAIASFFLDRLTFNDTPWDRFLAGDDDAMTEGQLRGAKVFMEIRCSICHNGATFSDDDFHNVALAQFGPGQGDGPLGNDDFGRFRVTGDPADLYKFRTTPLRNVELTGPFGHAGQFVELRAFIDHYNDSTKKLMEYDVTQLEPLLQGTLVPNQIQVLATRDTIITPVVFPDSITDRLMAFMSALTDERARNLSGIAPDRVPSGLSVDR
ncbi:MAG: cytochrome-c peroxidase [Gemmatimonadota bacterium]